MSSLLLKYDQQLICVDPLTYTLFRGHQFVQPSVNHRSHRTQCSVAHSNQSAKIKFRLKVVARNPGVVFYWVSRRVSFIPMLSVSDTDLAFTLNSNLSDVDHQTVQMFAYKIDLLQFLTQTCPQSAKTGGEKIQTPSSTHISLIISIKSPLFDPIWEKATVHVGPNFDYFNQQTTTKSFLVQRAQPKFEIMVLQHGIIEDEAWLDVFQKIKTQLTISPNPEKLLTAQCKLIGRNASNVLTTQNCLNKAPNWSLCNGIEIPGLKIGRTKTPTGQTSERFSWKTQLPSVNRCNGPSFGSAMSPQNTLVRSGRRFKASWKSNNEAG